MQGALPVLRETASGRVKCLLGSLTFGVVQLRASLVDEEAAWALGPTEENGVECLHGRRETSKTLKTRDEE